MNKKQVKVALYDADKKKVIGKTLTKSKFKTQKELDDYIERIKETQKEKNKRVKEEREESRSQEIYKMTTEQSSNINNFILDPNTGNTTVILGSSKRGKSTLMMKLYQQFYESDPEYISTLFSGNHHIGVYQGYKNLLVSEGFGPRSENYVKMEKFINSKTNNKYKFLNLFDDIIDVKYKKLINNLILTYRNANISTIMCLQYAMLLSKGNRANVNNYIIFGCNQADAKKDMIDLFLKPYFVNMGLTNYRDQINYFDKITDNFGFFYLNNVHNKMSTHRLNK